MSIWICRFKLKHIGFPPLNRKNHIDSNWQDLSFRPYDTACIQLSSHPLFLSFGEIKILPTILYSLTTRLPLPASSLRKHKSYFLTLKVNVYLVRTENTHSECTDVNLYVWRTNASRPMVNYEAYLCMCMSIFKWRIELLLLKSLYSGMELIIGNGNTCGCNSCREIINHLFRT